MRYTIKRCLFAGILCLVLPGAGFAATLSDSLENLLDLSRSADEARAAYDHAKRSGGEYRSHERQWHERESRLEDARVERLAKESGVSKSTIRALRRDGESWENIARRNGQDPARFGYGSSRYDHDRDSWKGNPPGLAKKGGIPPGQAKKMDRDRDDRYRHDGTVDTDRTYHRNDSYDGKRDSDRNRRSHTQDRKNTKEKKAKKDND